MRVWVYSLGKHVVHQNSRPTYACTRSAIKYTLPNLSFMTFPSFMYLMLDSFKMYNQSRRSACFLQLFNIYNQSPPCLLDLFSIFLTRVEIGKSGLLFKVVSLSFKYSSGGTHWQWRWRCPWRSCTILIWSFRRNLMKTTYTTYVEVKTRQGSIVYVLMNIVQAESLRMLKPFTYLRFHTGKDSLKN